MLSGSAGRSTSGPVASWHPQVNNKTTAIRSANSSRTNGLRERKGQGNFGAAVILVMFDTLNKIPRPKRPLEVLP
jgi:hypothetical protein